MQPMHQLEQEAIILNLEGANTEPILILGAACLLPSHKALSTGVRGRPEEGAAKTVEDLGHTKGAPSKVFTFSFRFF